MQLKRKFTSIWSVALFAAVVLGACAKQDSGAPAESKSRASAGSDMGKVAGDANKQGQSQSNGRGPGAGPGGRPGGQPPAAVITAEVRESEFASAIEALGTAKANEAVDISAKVSNRITAIKFREGQSVRKGEVLVELDSDEANADLAVAEAALGDSRSQVNRSRELALTKALSAQQMEQLESTMRANEARVAAARARLDELTIRAPFAGRVGLRNVSAGGLVNSGTVITTLDDISVMKLDFSVPETFLSMLSEGLEVDATSAAYAGQVFKGRVISVDSRIDPVSRSVTVRAQIPNRDSKLKPGLFMSVRLVHSDARALVIPEQALVPERDKQYVFAVRDGMAIKTEIVLGRRRPGEVEVLSGLRAGDVIVSEGTQKIRDGSAVRMASNASE